MKTTYFNFDIPTQSNDHKILGNVLASVDALAISEIAEQYDGLTVVVTPDTKSAVRLSQVLPDLTSQPVQFFPDWETLPYDSFSPHHCRESKALQVYQQPKCFRLHKQH